MINFYNFYSHLIKSPHPPPPAAFLGKQSQFQVLFGHVLYCTRLSFSRVQTVSHHQLIFSQDDNFQSEHDSICFSFIIFLVIFQGDKCSSSEDRVQEKGSVLMCDKH